MYFCTMKINRRFREDIVAMRIAAKYNLTEEYKYARRKGLSPSQSLDEWDLPIPKSGLQPTQCSANAQSQRFQRN